VREHTTSVHLMLDPADASQLHTTPASTPSCATPSMATSTACAATSPSAAHLSWPCRTHMRAELVAALHVAGRHGRAGPSAGRARHYQRLGLVH
jgi:hypothetical protein